MVGGRREGGGQHKAEYDWGSIVLICLVNVMHYSDITVRPLPGFNVLIGHNGSGKSAIVNAICLGLGGRWRAGGGRTGPSAAPSPSGGRSALTP